MFSSLAVLCPMFAGVCTSVGSAGQHCEDVAQPRSRRRSLIAAMDMYRWIPDSRRAMLLYPQSPALTRAQIQRGRARTWSWLWLSVHRQGVYLSASNERTYILSLFRQQGCCHPCCRFLFLTLTLTLFPVDHEDTASTVDAVLSPSLP